MKKLIIVFVILLASLPSFAEMEMNEVNVVGLCELMKSKDKNFPVNSCESNHSKSYYHKDALLLCKSIIENYNGNQNVSILGSICLNKTENRVFFFDTYLNGCVDDNKDSFTGLMNCISRRGVKLDRNELIEYGIL